MRPSLAWFLLLLAGCQLRYASQYPRPDPVAGAAATRVYFVGNSLSYYNDLPGLLAEMSRAESAPIVFQARLVAGQNLQGHWQDGIAVTEIRQGRFDLVVVQDYSTRPAADAEGSIESFRRFDREIRGSGAQMVIFENWTRAGRGGDAARLVETYRRVREYTGARRAPVGEAWERCRRDHPQIRLLADDRHPTPAGTYLAACVLFEVIYGRPAPEVTIPGARLSAERQAILRRVATETIRATTSRM